MNALMAVCLLSVTCSVFAATSKPVVKPNTNTTVTITESIRYYLASDPSESVPNNYVEHIRDEVFVNIENNRSILLQLSDTPTPASIPVIPKWVFGHDRDGISLPIPAHQKQ